MTKKKDQTEELALPFTTDGRKPVGQKTAISGAGKRISGAHEIGETVVLVIEAKVKSAGHEDTNEGIVWIEKLSTLDLFELETARGKKLLAALRTSYRAESGEPPLDLGEDLLGDEVLADASGVVMTPSEAAEITGDPSKALEETPASVVVIFEDESRALWPDDFEIGAPLADPGFEMMAPFQVETGVTKRVASHLDAVTGETLRKLELEDASLEVLEDEISFGEAEEPPAEELSDEDALAAAIEDRKVTEEILGDRASELLDPPDPETPLEQEDPPEANEDLELKGGPFEQSDELPFLPDVEHFAFVDRKVDEVLDNAKELTDRDFLLRARKAEEQGRGRDLKPRKGVLEGLEKRAAELYADLAALDAPDFPEDLGAFDVPEDAELEQDPSEEVY